VEALMTATELQDAIPQIKNLRAGDHIGYELKGVRNLDGTPIKGEGAIANVCPVHEQEEIGFAVGPSQSTLSGGEIYIELQDDTLLTFDEILTPF
jgi:hypothetical protein